MKTIVPALVLLALIFESSLSAKTTGKPEKAPLIKNDVDAFNYLNRFGYNPCAARSGGGKEGGPLLCQSTINAMVEEFQKKYKLPVTGKLDKKTLALMSAPRCGRADNVYKRAFVTANSWSSRRIAPCSCIDVLPFVLGRRNRSRGNLLIRIYLRLVQPKHFKRSANRSMIGRSMRRWRFEKCLRMNRPISIWPSSIDSTRKGVISTRRMSP